MNIRNPSAVEKVLISIALFTYPVLTLIVRHIMGVCFVFLVVICLHILYRKVIRLQMPTGQMWDHYSIAFSVAMVSPIFAVVVNQVYHSQFSPRVYDEPLRFLFTIPIFLGLRCANIDVVNTFKYAFPVSVLLTFIWVAVGDHYNEFDRLNTYFLNAIHFGNTALILGALSLFSIRINHTNSYPLTILLFTGFIAGMYLSIQSGSRGGWIAAPPLLVIWFYYQNKAWSAKQSFLLILLVVLFSLGVYLNVDTVNSRINEIFRDLRAFVQEEKDTSLGVRLQIWGAAAQLFLNNPVFGLGQEGYREQFSRLGEVGDITSTAVTYGMVELHQQILNYAVKFGLFGLLAILAVYFVPLVIFVRSTKMTEASRIQAGILGVCTVIGFLIFGLTADIFNLKMTVTFYSVTVAVLLSAATKNEPFAKIESIESKNK